MDAVVDDLDGFELKPKARAVRAMRLVPIAGMLSTFGTFLFFAILAIAKNDAHWWFAALAVLLVAASTDWLLWRVSRPPLLKADSVSVSYRAGFQKNSLARSELTLIYLGQVVQRGRYTAWVQSYAFAIADGKVRFAVPAFWFDADAIKAFGARLGVPVRGDFTQRVSGTVDEQAT